VIAKQICKSPQGEAKTKIVGFGIHEGQGQTQKESCKTFANLIAAARYGENETHSAQSPRRLAQQNIVYRTGLPQQDEPLEWLSQVCSGMACQVREALSL